MLITPNVELSRFYTNRGAADLLIKLMGSSMPGHVIDVGAGCGSLSYAAATKWSGVKLSTVDVDDSCIEKLSRKLSGAQLFNHTHYNLDALDEDLPNYITLGRPLFDVAISNPPYAGADWRPGYERILKEANLDDVYAVGGSVNRDIVFIAQLLRLTRPGGRIGVIVPDGIVSGIRSAKVRRKLLQTYNVRTVVQLPRGSFQKTEAQAFILIMENRPPDRRYIELVRPNVARGVTDTLRVERGQAEERMDFSFYRHHPNSMLDCTTLMHLGASIARGGLNSKEARAVACNVFHTTDFPDDGSVNLEFPAHGDGAPEANHGTVAEVGDILIARIDRNLHRKVCIVKAGRAVITDCIYRVRVAEDVRVLVLQALRSDLGADALSRAARGVAARVLNKRDLERLPLQLKSS